MSLYVNDDNYPATTVTLIRARFGDDWMSGSGVLVGRNDVLTASHVIYNSVYGLADEIIVSPSYDPSASDNLQFASADVRYFDQFDPDGDGRIYVGDGRSASQAGTEADIAMISLSSAIGDDFGWMEIDDSFESGMVNVTGHPGIYDFNMVQDSGSVYADPVDDYFRIDELEVNPGNSGGPIWYDYGAGPSVVGLVSTGISAVDLAGHTWLTPWIAENDYFLSETMPDQGGETPGQDEPDLVPEPEPLPEPDPVEAPPPRVVVNGTDRDDFLVGTKEADEINAGAGSDVLVGYGGNDIFDGGAGLDRANFHDEGTYDYSVSGITAEVRNQLTGDTDRLVDVERLSFEKTTVALDIGAGENAGQMYRLYQAAFDRTPDQVGLGYWISEFDSEKGDLTWVAKSFILSEEFKETYGSPATVSDEEFLDLLYENVLTRDPDEEGMEYWMEELDRGFERSRVLASFSESAENQANVIGSISDGIVYQEWSLA